MSAVEQVRAAEELLREADTAGTAQTAWSLIARARHELALALPALEQMAADSERMQREAAAFRWLFSNEDGGSTPFYLNFDGQWHWGLRECVSPFPEGVKDPLEAVEAANGGAK